METFVPPSLCEEMGHRPSSLLHDQGLNVRFFIMHHNK